MAQIPSTIRIENGQVYDQSNKQMDLTRPEFSVLHQAINQRGDASSWDNGEYRFDVKSNQLTPVSASSSPFGQSTTGGTSSNE